jgi:hypothetical protein
VQCFGRNQTQGPRAFELDYVKSCVLVCLLLDKEFSVIRLKSSGMLRRVDLKIGTDVSKDRSAFIFCVKQSKMCGTLLAFLLHVA